MIKRLPHFLRVVFLCQKLPNYKLIVYFSAKVVYKSIEDEKNSQYFVRSPYTDFLASFVDLIQKYLNSLKRLIMPINRHSRVLLVNKGV